MTVATIFIFLFSLGLLGWGLFRLKRVREQEETSQLINDSIHALYTTTRREIERNKKLVEKATELTAEARASIHPKIGGNVDLMDDPGMLATLVTVMVHKFGDIRLKMSDFEGLGDDDVVSVYVDTTEQDLILSFKRDLAIEDPITLSTYTALDDGTYH
jgi:hypothetical protein